MRKRLAIARALMHRPPVLFLDEPTAGLDPQGAEDVWTVLGELRREGVTVFMATHNMLEAERLPTRPLLIEEGRLIAEGTPQDIVAQAERIAVPPPKTNHDMLVRPLEDGRFAIVVPVDRLPSILKVLQEDGARLENVEIKESGLGEAFLRLTGRLFDDAEGEE